MSFQIVDDILDFTSSEKQLGKPVGSDLLNGHLTLPVLLEMRHNATFKSQIEALSPESPAEDFQTCIATIQASSSIQTAQEISDKYLAKAEHLIETLNNEHPKSLFKKLIQKMSKRST